VPSIVEYECSRKLWHLSIRDNAGQPVKSLRRLQALVERLELIELNRPCSQHAAKLWGEARSAGNPTSGERELDGDVLIAAQALSVKATVVTDNVKHLGRYCSAVRWQDITI
jgi:predicted nucleic acid-binding protein